MFAKVFTQIFESTIAENYKVRHVFMDLLVMADSDGIIDKTPESIARLSNVPLPEVREALNALCAPDLKSRTSDFDGRRLIPIEPGREWGWIIVNYDKYRAIRDEEARRIANRINKQAQRKREKEKKECTSTVINVSTSQPREREREIEKQINPKTYKGGDTTYSSEEKSPLPSKTNGKYTQSDYDERDIRKLSQAETEILHKLSAQVGASDPITEEEFFTAACEKAGITVERGLKLKKIQREWPKQ